MNMMIGFFYIYIIFNNLFLSALSIFIFSKPQPKKTCAYEVIFRGVFPKKKLFRTNGIVLYSNIVTEFFLPYKTMVDLLIINIDIYHWI